MARTAQTQGSNHAAIALAATIEADQSGEIQPMRQLTTAARE